MTINRFSFVISIFLGTTIFTQVFGGPREVATRMFTALTGSTLPLNDTTYRPNMENLIAQGNFDGAAQVATGHPGHGFYNIVLKQFAAPMSNRGESARVPLNDFMALVIGAVRDNRDFRDVLTQDIYYYTDLVLHPELNTAPNTLTSFSNSSNSHFEELDSKRIDLFTYLDPKTQSGSLSVTDAAGLLTTRAWAYAHLQAGTNRRAIEFSLQEFLCRTLESVRNTSVSDDRVRRDVDRAPGGVPETYQVTCRGCHSIHDALGGAYAYFDWSMSGTRITQGSSPVAKMNQNATVFPGGFITSNNSWVSRFSTAQETELGLSSAIPKSGNGIKALGMMLANARTFASCMSTRVFRNVCGRDPTSTEVSSTITTLTNDFIASTYRLKLLFEKASSLEACVGR
jgi:hypothetical protein